MPGTSRSALKGLYGSPGYMAPEILQKEPYEYKADSWSLGVTFYVLLAAALPFPPSSTKKARKVAITGVYDQLPLPLRDCSIESLDLLQRMLTVDPQQRYSMAEVHETTTLSLPWSCYASSVGFIACLAHWGCISTESRHRAVTQCGT